MADRLIAGGMLPAVDFGYYHGLLPLMVGRLWFRVVGDTPQAYLTLRAIIAVLTLFALLLLLRSIRAPRIIYVMSCAAIPFVFFYRPSLDQDMAALGVVVSLLLLVRRQYPQAASAALFSVFCHPSLGYVMLLAVVIAVGISNFGSFTRLLRAAKSVTAVAIGTLIAYFIASAIFFRSARPFLETLLPLTGRSVRQQRHWSFLAGGLTFIHPPGSNWRYLVGSPAASYLLLNLMILSTAIALAFVWRRYRVTAGPTLILFGSCFAVHAIYVLFVFGVPETWSYDVYLLVLGLAAVPFPRARHLFAIVITLALLLSYYVSWTSFYRHSHEIRVSGLWIDTRLVDEFRTIGQRQSVGKPYVWSEAGALSLLDGQVQSPQRWFVVAGTNPPSELARIKAELLSKPILYLYGDQGGPDYLFENPDFYDVRNHFREVERMGDLTVYERWP